MELDTPPLPEQESTQPIVVAKPENTDSITKPKIEPTEDAVEELATDELLVNSSPEEANVAETPLPPVAEDSPEVLRAIAAHNTALSNLNDSPTDRSLSRKFYAALAELAEASHTHDSAKGREAILSVYSDSSLFDLTSSAAVSWINWSKRQSAGVVVAGKIETVADNSEGVLLGIRTTDRRSSIVSVVVTDEDQDVSSLANRIGEELVFAGVVTNEQLDNSPLVVGHLLTQ